MLTGTSGEAFALTAGAWRTFTRTAAESADRMRILAGATTLDTRTTIDRARFARDVGCDGLLLGRPMWNALTPDATVGFYREVAEAVPELGIMVYDNPGAFKGSVTAWDRLAEIDSVVAVKYISVGPAYWEARRQIERADGDLVLVPMDAYLAATMTWDPELSPVCWSSSVSCGPGPTLALVDALEAGDWDRAVEISQRMAWSFETFFPGGDMETFGRHTVSIVKARMAEAGFLKPGPVRPPDPHTPDAYLEGGRQAGRRWRELVAEYAD
jgi:4-(2-carboxyphenyl)-2-oxobut-3-enoate aldolase